MASGDKEHKKAYDKRYYQEHKDKILANTNAYYWAHRNHRKAQRVAYKIAVFQAYGGPVCVCCGETHQEFLSIDHIHGNGASHRRQLRTGSGSRFYVWLHKQHYPAGFRVLCMNCNFALGAFGYCPHSLAKNS